ncbi:MAG TPA: PIN domain-containing protein [Terriglobia bacterium]|nr:PIN domain-containing protein [Terriglobia bacterium]
MARSAECYADTSAFIVFLDRSDSYHPVFRRLFSNPPALVTSSLVIVEGHGWFLRRYDARQAIEFLSFIAALAPLAIIPFGAAELEKSQVLVKKFHDQGLTLADAHGLVIMGERRNVVCWSTDRHLALTGVPLAESSYSP